MWYNRLKRGRLCGRGKLSPKDKYLKGYMDSQSSEQQRMWNDIHYYRDNLNYLTFAEWNDLLTTTEHYLRSGMLSGEQALCHFEEALERFDLLDLTAGEKKLFKDRIEHGIVSSKISIKVEKPKGKIGVYWEGDKRYPEINGLLFYREFMFLIIRDFENGKISHDVFQYYGGIAENIFSDVIKDKNEYGHTGSVSFEELNQLIEKLQELSSK